MQRACSVLFGLVACLAVLAAPLALAEPAATLQGVVQQPLKDELARAIGDVKARPKTQVEARRRARDAAKNATALLRSEGYYQSTVVPDVSETDPPRATVTVTPGPLFLLTAPRIEWMDAAPAAPAARAADEAMNLKPGAPGRAADIIEAEARAVLALERLGYADAQTRPREVIVDHATLTVQPTFKITAGEVVRLGALVVADEGHTKASWVRTLAPWKVGEIYAPPKITTLERRLTSTGVYQSASATLAQKDDSDGLRPVVVTLVEAPRRTLELGAAYSTTAGAGFDSTAAMGGSSFGVYSTLEGSGVDGKWINYNLLGVADTTTLTARLYDIQQVLDAEIDLPDWLRPDQIFKAGADVLNERTPAYNDAGAGIRLAVERHWTKTTYLTLGGYLDYVSLSEKEAINPDSLPVGEKLNLLIPTALVAFVLDRSDNALNPTRGWRLHVRAEPTWVTGDRDLTYVKVLSQITAYLPVAGQGGTVLAMRLAAGSILGGNLPGVPADRRFYAGGGGSVRGFAYQAVGPRLLDNTPQGGLSLAEASFEVRQKLTSQWGVVGFIDAGSVGDTPTPVLAHPSVGAGVGVRYDLGFGPIRLDVGTPLNPRKGDAPVQLYISIGQSF